VRGKSQKGGAVLEALAGGRRKKGPALILCVGEGEKSQSMARKKDRTPLGSAQKGGKGKTREKYCESPHENGLQKGVRTKKVKMSQPHGGEVTGLSTPIKSRRKAVRWRSALSSKGGKKKRGGRRSGPRQRQGVTPGSSWGKNYPVGGEKGERPPLSIPRRTKKKTNPPRRQELKERGRKNLLAFQVPIKRCWAVTPKSNTGGGKKK